MQRPCAGRDDGKSKGLQGLCGWENSAGVESGKGAVAKHTKPSDHSKESEFYSKSHVKS